jgi:transposase-like protein
MCIQSVDKIICKKCNSDHVVKNGKNKKEQQRYLCEECLQSHQSPSPDSSGISRFFQSGI